MNFISFYELRKLMQSCFCMTAIEKENLKLTAGLSKLTKCWHAVDYDWVVVLSVKMCFDYDPVIIQTSCLKGAKK